MPRVFSGGCTHLSQHPPHSPQAGHTWPQKSDQCQQRDAQRAPSLLKPLCLLQRGCNTLRSSLNWSRQGEEDAASTRAQCPFRPVLPRLPRLRFPQPPQGLIHGTAAKGGTPHQQPARELKHFSPLFWSLGETFPLIFTATFFLHEDKSTAMSPAQSLLSAHSTNFRKPHRVCGSWSPQ